MLFRRAVCALSAPVRRTITTTPIKRSSDPLIGHVNQEAMPGLNIPININQNRYKVAAMLIAFFGSAFSAPFIIVRYQLKKKSS